MIPTAIEDRDLPDSRQTRDVALETPLSALAGPTTYLMLPRELSGSVMCLITPLLPAASHLSRRITTYKLWSLHQ